MANASFSVVPEKRVMGGLMMWVLGCPGAGTAISKGVAATEPLNDGAFVEVLNLLPRRPFLAGDKDIRLSPCRSPTISNCLSSWGGDIAGALSLWPEGEAAPEAWLTDLQARAISISLPKQSKAFNRRQTRSFFAGLLPDEGQRDGIGELQINMLVYADHAGLGSGPPDHQGLDHAVRTSAPGPTIFSSRPTA